MTGTGRNLTDQLRFREAVSLFLNLSGHTDAAPKPVQTRVSEGIGASLSDVRGIPGWFLATSSRTTLRLTDDLNTAHAEADDGEHVAVIQHLRSRPLADSLVVMDLQTFSEITAPSP